MKPNRIFITSIAFLIIVLCFTPQSEGQSFCHLNKTLATPQPIELCAHLQHPLASHFYNSFQYDDTEDFTPFCNRLNHCCHHDEIFSVYEKKCVLSKWLRYTGASQRPPPLYNPLNI